MLNLSHLCRESEAKGYSCFFPGVLVYYFIVIPVSQMICKQVFSVFQTTANDLANVYALEYKVGGKEGW